MKLAIIMPQSEKHRYRKGRFGWSKTLGYEPPGLSLLATLAKNTLGDNTSIQVVDEMTQTFYPHALEADLVGITVITPTANRAYEMAGVLRARGIKVILGGRHVTLCPDEALNHADAIVTGRAEQVWPELLKDFVKGGMRCKYIGSSKAFGEIVADRNLTSHGYITKNTVQSSVGCPYRCTFCVVPKTQQGYVHADLHTLLSEIEQFPGKTFLDLSLSPMEKVEDGFLKMYLRGLATLKKKWGGLSTAQALEDKELFNLLVKSGLKGVLIGLESLNSKSLHGMGKGFNKPERYLELIRKLHDHGVVVNGCFIFGSDEDDTDTFARTVDFAFQAGIDLPRFAIMTPFPGTPLFTKLCREGRLLHTDWSRYGTQHAVFEPRHMTPAQLEAGLAYAWKNSYSALGISKRIVKSSRQGTLSMLPISLASNLGYLGYTKFPTQVPQPCERR